MRAGQRQSGYTHDIFLSSTEDLGAKARDVAAKLEARGFRVVAVGHHVDDGCAENDEVETALERSQHAVFLIGREFSTQLDSELRRFARQLLDDQANRIVLPIRFYDSSSQSLPSLFQRSQIDASPDEPTDEVAARIAYELKSTR